MKDGRIPLYDIRLDSGTIAEVRDTLTSGWLTTGPKVRKFEKAVAAYLRMRYTVAVSSATAGLNLCLQAVGVEGKEVVTTPFTFMATVEAILQSGGIPVMADIDPDTLTVDPDEVTRKISHKTACLLPVDIAGHPADYDSLGDIAQASGLPVIADASHSMGAKYRGKPIPRLAEAAVFSFHSTKNLTCGEGGMVVSRFGPLVDIIRKASLHGLTAGAYARRLQKKWLYDVEQLGFKANMSDVHAAIDLGQLRLFEKNQARRRAIARRYFTRLASLDDHIALPHISEKVEHAWHLFIIRLHLSRLKITRDRFIGLMSRRGVECGVHYQPVFNFTLFKESGYSGQYLPNAAYAGKRVVSLPMYPGLKLSQVDYVCEQVSDIISRHGR
ncbi:MAG: DegT/DnrJ/EryC1/StrS family aminotransferase [Candidatus Zixiibacteriota bacterium]|nr:MAG: DegT/DnrJ/EryC1/StrS family aminotransferase [candidate division Zixibacteria bacterium]